jgi:hypothetical protein
MKEKVETIKQMVKDIIRYQNRVQIDICLIMPYSFIDCFNSFINNIPRNENLKLDAIGNRLGGRGMQHYHQIIFIDCDTMDKRLRNEFKMIPAPYDSKRPRQDIEISIESYTEESITQSLLRSFEMNKIENLEREIKELLKERYAAIQSGDSVKAMFLYRDLEYAFKDYGRLLFQDKFSKDQTLNQRDFPGFQDA